MFFLEPFIRSGRHPKLSRASQNTRSLPTLSAVSSIVKRGTPRSAFEGLRSRLHIGADLHRVSVRIDHVETEAATLLVDRSHFPRLEIGSHGFLLEVVDSDREMIHFGCRLTLAQDQEVFAKHELVVSFSFVYFAIE